MGPEISREAFADEASYQAYLKELQQAEKQERQQTAREQLAKQPPRYNRSRAHAQPPWWLRHDLTGIGLLLAEYFRDHGLATQQEFAKHLGIKQQSLSEYLAPHGRIPQPRALQRIAHATGIPLITLYHAAGIRLYGGLGAPPPEQPAEPIAPPPGTTGDMWQGFYAHLERLHAEGKLSRDVAEGLMNEAENIRLGYDPMRKHIIAEHAKVVPEFPPTPAELPHQHALTPTGVGEVADEAP